MKRNVLILSALSVALAALFAFQTHAQDSRSGQWIIDTTRAANQTRTVDHGVNSKFIKSVEELGYGHPALEQLVRMQDHGVNAKFIVDLKELGFQNLPIEQLVRMQDHGVSAAFIKKMRSKGFNETSIDELIKLADRGFNNER